MAYYITNRLTKQYFKHDFRRENAKYCMGRYVRYTIKAVPHKVFSRFNPSNVETHAREGKFRYSEKIPPGYMDEYKNKKDGLQKYGDLFAWKQILDIGKIKAA